MTVESELLAAVDRAFARTGREHRSWPAAGSPTSTTLVSCDSGSQDELDRFDDHMLGIVSGAFRRLSDGGRKITVIRGPGWSASGRFKRHEVEAVLADPAGWSELAGKSWLGT